MKTLINNQSHEVDPKLEGFSFNKKASTNIEFFGHNPATSEMFVQFKMGTTYFYKGVPIDVMKAALETESIGKFFHAHIKGQYESEGFAVRMVEIIQEDAA